MIDRMTRAVVSLSVPIAMFGKSFDIATEMGYVGASRFIAALANLGGPFGNVGGLVVLFLVILLGDTLISIGMEELLVLNYALSRYQGRASSRVRAEVNGLWLSYEMRKRVLARIGC